MVYPSAPWTLCGQAFLTLHLIDHQIARSLVPPELEIISVLPGKTLGGTYFAAYTDGSVLQYNELIVTAAAVRCGQATGSWISHIYVDHPDSMAGGREIWGLPKELADFTWTSNQVTVSQSGNLLCTCNWQSPWLSLPTAWQPRMSGKILSQLGADWLLFEGRFQGALAVGKSQLTIPSSSPFFSLKLGQPLLQVAMNPLTFQAGAPQVIGQVQGGRASVSTPIAG